MPSVDLTDVPNNTLPSGEDAPGNVGMGEALQDEHGSPSGDNLHPDAHAVLANELKEALNAKDRLQLELHSERLKTAQLENRLAQGENLYHTEFVSWRVDHFLISLLIFNVL